MAIIQKIAYCWKPIAYFTILSSNLYTQSDDNNVYCAIAYYIRRPF